MLESNFQIARQFDAISFVDDIVSNMDDVAMDYLLSGSTQDVESLLEMMIEEANRILITPNSTLDKSMFQSMDPFVDTLEIVLRRESLNYFILSVLPEFYLGPHHLEWGNLAQIYRLLCILAARGHGKSYFYSKAYLIWQLYRYASDQRTARNEPIRFRMSKEGMLITNEYKLANHLLSLVKEEIEENPILRDRLYPDNRRDGWGAESIVAKNGAKLTAKSVGSKMRGFHPTYIVCDDYLNDQVLYSTEQNRKYIDHFHSVTMNMLEPGGQCVVVGTPFREDDLYVDLKGDRDKQEYNEWKVFEFPGIYPDGRVLWPERHSLHTLLAKREKSSMIFSREILVKPISTASSLFPFPTLKACFNENISLVPNINSTKIRYKKVVLSADFAISANIGADFSVFFVLGVTDNDHYHILSMWRKSGSKYDEQVGQLKRMYSDFNPDVVLVEDNGMQKIFVQMLNDAGVPATGQTTTAEKKYNFEKGIPAMAALFEQGRIHIPRGDRNSIDMMDILVSELTSFTWNEDKGKIQGVGAHDDSPMALWIGISATKVGTFNYYLL